MDYVTIAGELESKASLFVRYIKSASIPTDDTITQTIKPIEPPNTIRGLCAACEYLPRVTRTTTCSSASVHEMPSSEHPGDCVRGLPTSFLGECRCVETVATSVDAHIGDLEAVRSTDGENQQAADPARVHANEQHVLVVILPPYQQSRRDSFYFCFSFF